MFDIFRIYYSLKNILRNMISNDHWFLRKFYNLDDIYLLSFLLDYINNILQVYKISNHVVQNYNNFH